MPAPESGAQVFKSASGDEAEAEGTVGASLKERPEWRQSQQSTVRNKKASLRTKIYLMYVQH